MRAIVVRFAIAFSASAVGCGISYAYIGNTSLHGAESTVCPHCGTLLIEREGYRIIFQQTQRREMPALRQADCRAVGIIRRLIQEPSTPPMGLYLQRDWP